MVLTIPWVLIPDSSYQFHAQQKIKKVCKITCKPFHLYLYGSPGRARTADLVINSHPLYQLSYRGLIFMARPERFELPTARFVAEYSIQLSYGRITTSYYPLLLLLSQPKKQDAAGTRLTSYFSSEPLK